MKKQNYNQKTIIFSLLIFFIISIITIYSCLSYLKIDNILYKQIIFYILGFIMIFMINKINLNKLLKKSYLLYIGNIIFLILVLFLGTETNGSKAWLYIPFIGSFQPSEFMKISLILFLSYVIKRSKDLKEKDFIIIVKSVIIFLIPTILTFLEPDTGAVIIYFIITVIMLFTSGIRLRWFILLFLIIILFGGSFLYLYYFKENLFINLFGSSFFYRLDRIFDWTTSSGMQLTNSLISIASSGYFGNGINNILLYFPELQTDFIFASYISLFGIVGAFFLFLTFVIFDLTILNISLKTNNLAFKLIITSSFSILLYQQIQNTYMTIGLLPIMGITLPFISYGGSSLLSYFILIGIILNIEKQK